MLRSNYTYNCPQCNKEFRGWKHHNRKFCSIKCASLSRYPNPAKDSKERARRWYSKNKKRWGAKVKERYENNKDYILTRARVRYHGRYRDSKLAKLYGVSKEEAQKWLAIKYCEICGTTERKLNIDHDHTKTSSIRGRLCENCNRGLGMFGDSSETLSIAAKYLQDRSGEGA